MGYIPDKYFDFSRWKPPRDRHERAWEAYLWATGYGTSKYDEYLIEDDGRLVLGETTRREYPWVVWDEWDIPDYYPDDDFDDKWPAWWRGLERDPTETIELTLKGYLP